MPVLKTHRLCVKYIYFKIFFKMIKLEVQEGCDDYVNWGGGRIIKWRKICGVLFLKNCPPRQRWLFEHIKVGVSKSSQY